MDKLFSCICYGCWRSWNKIFRSLIPKMTLWIPEKDSVPYSQPKGTYYL